MKKYTAQDSARMYYGDHPDVYPAPLDHVLLKAGPFWYEERFIYMNRNGRYLAVDVGVMAGPAPVDLEFKPPVQVTPVSKMTRVWEPV